MILGGGCQKGEPLSRPKWTFSAKAHGQARRLPPGRLNGSFTLRPENRKRETSAPVWFSIKILFDGVMNIHTRGSVQRRTRGPPDAGGREGARGAARGSRGETLCFWTRACVKGKGSKERETGGHRGLRPAGAVGSSIWTLQTASDSVPKNSQRETHRTALSLQVRWQFQVKREVTRPWTPCLAPCPAPNTQVRRVWGRESHLAPR